MDSLKGKIIIVTGGSGLIGKEIVGYLKIKEAICYNLDFAVNSNLQQLEIQTDITNKDSIDTAIQQILDKHGRIDGWVNNAYPRTKDWGTKFEEIPFESWQTNVDLQLNSIFRISQIVLEIFKDQAYGSLVNIASIYGIVGNDFTVYENVPGLTSPAAYSAIKGGLINFSRYLASYYGKYNVRVNCVSPGGIKDQQHPEFIKSYEHKVPMKRLGLPVEIGAPVAFLLSDEASYITGHNLVVDGGWTAI